MGLVGEVGAVVVACDVFVGDVTGVFLFGFEPALLVLGFLPLPVLTGVSTLLLFFGSGVLTGVSGNFFLPPSDDFRLLSGFCETLATCLTVSFARD